MILNKLCIVQFAFLLSISSFGFGQIDTAKIFTEIRSLSDESLIQNYWTKLDSSDQDLKTFAKPITQIENLLKCVYFFKIHGFVKREHQREDYSLPITETAQIIWMHNPYFDLSSYTFPLISECQKHITDFSLADYLVQSVIFPTSKLDTDFRSQILEYYKLIEFEKININDLVAIANDYVHFHYLYSKQIVSFGKWHFRQFFIDILKIDGDRYFLYFLGTSYQLGSSYKINTTDLKVF